MKLHHYGFATKSIQKSLQYFLDLGYEAVSEQISDTLQGVDLLFIKNSSDHLIELVSPAIENSPVSKILSKSGASLYHICYEVDDLHESIDYLKSKKYILVLAPTPAIAFNNKRICFLYQPHIGLIELLEK